MDKHIIENEIPRGEMEDIGNSLDDFEIMQTLGKGSYGFVSKVKSRKNQKIYAMKMIDLELVNDQQEIDLLMNEIKIIQNLNSPHIVKYYCNFQIGKKIYILMEYINNGDIKGYIQANSSMQKAISEPEIWELMYQCVSGICYIHQNNLIHRDIKPANLFLTDDKVVKIGDFGVSAERKVGTNFHHKYEKETLMIGTPLYMSPEIFAHQPYGSKVDVYSLGCTFYELCYFSAPRLPLPAVNQYGEIVTDLKAVPPKANKDFYSQDLKNIIDQMIEKDQNKRPKSEKIFEQIKMKYNSFQMQSSSIFCVYRCLLSYNNLVGKLKKHTQVNLPIDQIPITFTFNLALTNLYMPDKQSYPIINKIRDVLTYYNSTLIDPGEIECNELIKYIIGKMSLETNHNRTCDSPYLFTQEDDPSSFNRDSMMKKYLLNFQNFFKSFISNYFFGTLETTRTCCQCKQMRTFFENFLYLTININIALKSGFITNNENFIFSCLQNCPKIRVNKLCPNCNNFTIQEEKEQIFSYPINLILYIKNDDENNLVNLIYPLILNLQCTSNPMANVSYNLKAVIQKCVQNGQKTYCCCFSCNQNWCVANGYNMMNTTDSPYKCNLGNVVMLFYSCQN